jgi:hypothetical protein
MVTADPLRINTVLTSIVSLFTVVSVGMEGR